MPIRTDKIYNKNTNDYIETDYLLKYNPDDKTIRTLLDEILINLNELENLNVKEINLLIEEWNKKIDNITNQYEILYNNLSKIDVLENYIDDIKKIEEKVNNLENLFNKKLIELENKINSLNTECNKKYNNLNNKINDTEKNIINNFNDKFNDLNNQIDGIENQIFNLLNPNANVNALNSSITKKIYLLKNMTNSLINPVKITRYEYNGFLTESRGTTSKTITVSRYIFTSGKTYLKYEFTDTETTNYFDLINPITGESKRFNDCGSSGGSRRTKCEHNNLDLRYLLNEQDGDEIQITFKVYQGDYPGFGYIVMYNEEYPNNINSIHNINSKLINYKVISEFSNQFQATAVCDMKDNNYPFDNNHILGTGLGDSMKSNLYTSKDNDNPLYFKIPIKLKKGKYEIGSLIYDLESSEGMSKVLKIIKNNNVIYFDILQNKFISNLSEKKFDNFGLSNENITWFKYQIDIDDDYDNVYLCYFGKYYQILDFYFKNIDESYIKNSDFLPLHSESKLPITWSGKINNNELIAVPNKKFINKDYNSFIEIDNKNLAFYKISFDIHLSGSWDGEQYGIKLNDKLIFKDNTTQKKYEPFNYKSNIVKFEKYNDKFCSWANTLTTDNKDIIGHFEITDFFDKNILLQFFNTLNEDYENEMMNVLNIKVESLPNYKIYKYWNISNFENNSQLSKNNIIKENGGFVVFTDKIKKLTENIKLNIGKQYFLRLSILSINTIDTTDKIQININDKNYFNYGISQYDEKIKNLLNKSQIDKNIILCESGELSNITNENFKFLNGKYYIRSVIEIPFIAKDENKIEIVFNKNQDKNDEIYALESLIIYENFEKQITPIFTNKIKRIETGYSNNWKIYDSKGLYIDIDTSNYNFSDNVIYFTSLSGNGHLWKTTGTTSIYNPTKNGFRVYLYCNYDSNDYLNDAKQYNWILHWIGIEYEN